MISNMDSLNTVESKCLHLISYLSLDDILNVLSLKDKHIICALIIYHDKDDNESHYHILLYLIRSRKIDSVRNWFKIDERNTLARVNGYSKQSSFDYLLHRNSASLEDGKYQYIEEDLVYYNCDKSFFISEKVDNSYNIIDNILNGVPIRQLCKLYGRDFIYHYNAYRTICSDILKQEVNATATISVESDVLNSAEEVLHQISIDELPF